MQKDCALKLPRHACNFSHIPYHRVNSSVHMYIHRSRTDCIRDMCLVPKCLPAVNTALSGQICVTRQ